MKITIVLGPFYPLPPTGIGAVEKVWYELAGEFIRAGHEILLVGKAAGQSGPAGVPTLPLKGYSATGRLWRDLLKDLAYAMEVCRRLEPADLVVTNSFWTPVVLQLLRSSVGKVLVHVARYPKGQMWLYARAHSIQPISSAVADEVLRQTPSLEGKVTVINYPVDVSIYAPPAIPRRYDQDLTILYVGRIHPEKGLDMLVRAFRRVVARVPRARLKLVGPADVGQGGGDPAWVDALKQASKGLPIEIAGPIADKKVLASELQQAHCFCYPSIAEKGEALGLAALEAMATGLPAVVSDLACFRDFLTNGQDGCVFDHRAADAESRLAEALIAIVSDEALATRLGQNAAVRAKDFALERVAARYLQLFETIVART